MVERFPEETKFEDTLFLLRVEDFRPGHHIELVIDGEEGQAVAFLVPNSGKPE
ncbi:hypothetical protein ACFLYP_01270 [Chloroflexota bacterium]